MADPASLALSVLPLIVGAAETYRRAYDKIHLFRHSSREIQRVQRSLLCQKAAFTLECQLLLRLVLPDDETIAQMLDDTAHALWDDSTLNDELAKCLDRGFEACCVAIQSVTDKIEDLDDALKCFDGMDHLRAKGDKTTCKQTKPRIKSKLKIAFDKSRFEKAIADLREYNEDLSKLRLQISELQAPPDSRRTKTISQRIIPKEVQAVREASQALHGTLASQWSCGDPTHGEHSAKLYVEARVEDCVRLDIVISYRSRQRNLRDGREYPIRLFVRSESLEVPLSRALAFSTSTTEVRALLRNKQQGTTLTSTITTSSSLRSRNSSGCHPPAKKRKCVTFSTPEPSNARPASTNVDNVEPLPQNCLGYLDAPSQFRHVFYSNTSMSTLGSPASQGFATEDIIRINELLCPAVEDDISTLDRLKLARRIAIAMLQYHNTPWLSKHWDVQNFAFFGSHTEISETTLQTLHLASKFSDNGQDSNMSGLDSQIQDANDEYEEARLERGIENITLWSLGASLLQIAYWRPIDSFDVRNVRKSAGRVSKWVGPQFQKIVEKCIRCDFGYGSNLNEMSLQSAVYYGVVCELEDLIAKLDIS